MKTILNDRVLWFDGDSSFTDDELLLWVLDTNDITSNIHPVVMSTEIDNFNKFSDLKLVPKNSIDDLNVDWDIPQYFLDINIKNHVYRRLDTELDVETPELNKKKIERVKFELSLFNKLNLDPVLQTIIYIISMFEYKNIIWGTGRGSSCSSYIFYLLGLHDVDSVLYDLDVNEFFKYKENV